MSEAANPDVTSGVSRYGGRHIVRQAVDVRLLGPLQVLDGAGRPVELSGDRPRGLLAVLALELPNFVPADRLVDWLWGPEVASSPEAALHVAMSRLRKALGEDVIKTQAGGYRLEIPVANSDVERFRRHARRGRQLLTLGRPGPAAEAFRQALAQWRGIPLADLRRFEFAEQAGRVLEEERLVTVEQLMEAELTAGNHDLVVGELSGLVEAFPLREKLWEQLMLALYRGGRQAEALRAYSRLRQLLSDELGVEPSLELAELEERILLHDPGLETVAEPDEGDWLDEPEIINFSPNEVIVEEGGLADLVYWIEEGRVEVVRTGEDGDEVVVAELGPGRYFGELASLLGTARTATVRAVSPTTVSVHTVEGFRRRLGVERTKERLAPTPIEEVRELIKRGEYLRAYDQASKLIETMRSDPEVRYLAVLSLARSGATAQAIRRYEQLGLQSVNPDSVSARMAEDITALAARLDKDMAQIDVGRRRQWATRSAAGYEAAFQRHRSAYLAVNAATMWLLAGEREQSEAAAGEALAALAGTDTESNEDRYWEAASEAEAALILGEVSRAEEALIRAGQLSEGNGAARATTLRQLRQLCSVLGIDQALLSPIRNSAVVHYCGHRIGVPASPSRFPPEEESRVAAEIEGALSDLKVGVGFGSLAAGADIIMAEALLARGAELQVLLPFDRDEFVRTSVAPAGSGWVDRFERCIAGAQSVTTSFIGEYLDDPVLFDFCSRVAMGDAVMRASFLEAEVHQIAVWDGVSAEGPAGTGADVARWQALGRPNRIIRVTGAVPNGSGDVAIRQIRALVFGDFAGFSRLSDAQVQLFHDLVMTALARQVDQFRPHFLSGNTWGDGLYLVFDDVPAAAECALALQELIKTIDLRRSGLEGLRGMRIAAHAGPVFEGTDPMTGRPTFFGAGVTQAARIEPRTPEGEVYLTHPFAALVSLTAGHTFHCSYVGTLPVAKGYGYFPLFALRRRVQGAGV